MRVESEHDGRLLRLLRYSVGMSARELRQVRLVVIEHRDEFRERWNEHFGT
ncbi:MAG: hypothetical protein HY906_18065 [Deltaproteobacteria bacterium]|nr:hypothetical protein [Deltaproteobacteria bacterium]